MILKNLFTGQQWRKKCREQTYGHGERGGEGEMYGKSNMEAYITICKIDSQREFAVCLSSVQFSSVAQSCPTLCNPMDTRLLRPWDFLGKSTGVDCHFLL